MSQLTHWLINSDTAPGLCFMGHLDSGPDMTPSDGETNVGPFWIFSCQPNPVHPCIFFVERCWLGFLSLPLVSYSMEIWWGLFWRHFKQPSTTGGKAVLNCGYYIDMPMTQVRLISQMCITCHLYWDSSHSSHLVMIWVNVVLSIETCEVIWNKRICGDPLSHAQGIWYAYHRTGAPWTSLRHP